MNSLKVMILKKQNILKHRLRSKKFKLNKIDNFFVLHLSPFLYVFFSLKGVEKQKKSYLSYSIKNTVKKMLLELKM